MKQSRKNQNSGFSFIELAMIITIAALLVGAILVGQELIHQFKVRNLIAQFIRYDTSKNTFDSKYRGLPGDIVNAEAIGLSGGNCPTQPGCNGNGDRTFDVDTSNPENLNFWYHLNQAGMIKDTLDGLTAEYGVGMPATGLGNDTGIAISHMNNYNLMDRNYEGNFFVIGIDPDLIDVNLTMRDTYTIDKKIDDGIAVSGRAFARGHVYHNTCIYIYYGGVNDYEDFDNENRKCSLYIEF